jgi:hypothetical protein
LFYGFVIQAFVAMLTSKLLEQRGPAIANKMSQNVTTTKTIFLSLSTCFYPNTTKPGLKWV